MKDSPLAIDDFAAERDNESRSEDLPSIVLSAADFRLFCDTLHAAWMDFVGRKARVHGSKRTQFLTRMLAIEILCRIRADETTDPAVLLRMSINALNIYDFLFPDPVQKLPS